MTPFGVARKSIGMVNLNTYSGGYLPLGLAWQQACHLSHRLARRHIGSGLPAPIADWARGL